VRGGYRALWVFVLLLANSRACFAELVLSLDVHSLRRSLVRSGIALGGLPRQWLFDNAKTIVLERHGDAVRFHPLLLDLAARLHVQPRLCAPRRPQSSPSIHAPAPTELASVRCSCQRLRCYACISACDR
jgi:transposase